MNTQSVGLSFKAEDEDFACYFYVNEISTRPSSVGTPQIKVVTGGEPGKVTASGSGCIAEPYLNEHTRTITFKIILPVTTQK